MWDTFANIFRIPDLRNRVLFTAAILALLQIGKYIPVPGIDVVALNQAASSSGGGFFQLFNLFAGGAFMQCSIFALGIMPYINASIILQLLTVSSPYLEELSKKGEEGRRKINQYTRYLTVFIAAVQAFMFSFVIENPGMFGNVVIEPGWTFRILCMISMVAGTCLLMWMGELITENGVGNGISLIIFINIIAMYPGTFQEAWIYLSNENPAFTPFDALITFTLLVAVVGGVVMIQYGQRRVPIKRGRQVSGGRMYSGQPNAYLPLRINTAGVIPVIFAAAILTLPGILYQFTMPFAASENLSFINEWMRVVSDEWFAYGGILYCIVYTLLIIFFCYFYTAITFNPKDVAENLQKSGSTVPGYSHGKRTEEYLSKILNRITLAGAIFLASVSVLPYVVQGLLQIPPNIAQLLGGTSLIIVVGVALDTVNQVENHLRVRNYEGFRKRGRIRGRSGM